MPRSYRHNPTIRYASRAALAAVVLATCLGARAQDAPPAPPVANPTEEPTLSQRMQALAVDASPEAIDRLSLALRRDEPPGSRRAAARALADVPDPPDSIVPALAQALRVCSESDAVEVLRALGRFPTTEAIYAVMSFREESEATSETLARAIGRAAASQTARPELARDEAALAAWWARFGALPERERRAELAIAHARRFERLSTELDAINGRLIDAYRRLFAASTDDARAELLSELIRSEQTGVRMLGIELATRTILNAKPVGPKVAEAAVASLRHPDAPVRAASAVLVDRLNLEEHAAPCSAALAAEQDPLAASAMMRFLSRHPAPEVADAALRWFSEPGPVGDAATELILAMLREDQLREQQIDAVRSMLRERGVSQMTPQSVALLDALGEHEQIMPLLNAADAAVASAAASALGRRRESLAIVLDAALARPDLFEPACRALMRHRPDASGFGEAAALEASNPQRKRELLAEFAGTLPPAALLEVARATKDLATRELYLRRAGTPEYLSVQEDASIRCELAELLAHTRMRLNDPAGALATLEALPASEDDGVSARRAAQRVHCLVWLNRLGDAEELSDEQGVAPDAWLAGLDSAIELPHALSIVERIRTRYGPELSPDDAARVERVAELLIGRDDTPPPVDGGDEGGGSR